MCVFMMQLKNVLFLDDLDSIRKDGCILMGNNEYFAVLYAHIGRQYLHLLYIMFITMAS